MTEKKSNMRGYILKSPELIKEYLEKPLDKSTQNIVDYLNENSDARVVLTGCGTSYHVALLFERYLSKYYSPNVVALPSMDLLAYRSNLLDDAIVFSISHSGAAKPSVDVVKAAKKRSRKVFSVTAVDTSEMAKLSDDYIKMVGGFESSLPKTMSYTVTAVQLLRLTSNLKNTSSDEKLELPSSEWLYTAMNKAITENEDDLIKVAKALKDSRRFISTGSGTDWVLANEVAIKMRENNYSSTFGFETEEFTHGNTTLFEPNTVSLIITHHGPALDRSKDVFHSAKYLGATTFVIGDDSVKEYEGADFKFEVETTGNEMVDGLIYALPLQLFSYHISWEMGVDPDTLRRHDEKYDYVGDTWIFPPGTH